MLVSYVAIQFNIKTFEKNYDLIIRLFNNIVHYMNELALKALWFESSGSLEQILASCSWSVKQMRIFESLEGALILG